MERDSSALREEILAMLKAELGLQQRHMALLLKQRDALIAVDRKVFALLHDQHETLLKQMELQAAQRAKLLSGSGARYFYAGSEWPKTERQMFTFTVDQLRSIVKQVRTQSAQNQKLIDNDLKYLDFEVGLIINVAKTGSRYAKSGVPVSLQANRLINQVA